MKTNRTRIILRNIVSNCLGYVVQAAVVFFLTPYVLRELGDVRYGVWILISSITGTYGLLAFGLQGGVNQYLTRYLANREFQKMNEVASTATAVLSLVGVAILLMSLAIGAILPYAFDVPAQLTNEVLLSIVIVGASVAVQMGLFVFSSAFMATQRYDLSNAVGVATRLLSAGLVYSMLKLDYGIVGVSAAMTASNIFDYLLRWRLAYRLIPELRIRSELVTWPVFNEMFGFGAWSFLGTIAQSLNTSSDAIIIGMMLPMPAMAPYALAQGLTRQLDSLLAPASMVFFPALTELHSRDDTDCIRHVYLAASRLLLVIVAVLAAITAAFAKDFFLLWVGNEYVTGNAYPSVAVLYQILVIAMVFRLLPGIGSQVLLATLNVRQLTITYLAGAMANIVLTLVLIRPFGLIGVALASLLAAVGLRALVVPWLVGKVLNVSMATFVGHVWLRPFLLAIATALLAVSVRDAYTPKNFTDLLMLGGVVAVGSTPLILFIGMTSQDRHRLVSLLATIRQKSTLENVLLPVTLDEHGDHH